MVLGEDTPLWSQHWEQKGGGKWETVFEIQEETFNQSVNLKMTPAVEVDLY